MTMISDRRSRIAVTLATIVTTVTLAMVLAGCSKPAAKPTIPSTQPLTVTVAPIEFASINGGLSASGLLTSKLEAAVSTQLSGYRVAQVFVDQGAEVIVGQPMAKLDDTLLRSQISQQEAVVAQQQVAAERSEAEAQRVAGLDNAGILPQEQIAERRLAARGGRAAVSAAEAQLADLRVREGLMTVRAPVGGLVLDRTVRPGDVASPANPMFRLCADGVVELNAEVPESSLAGIKPGDLAHVSLPDGAVLQGRVRLVSPQVDQQTKLGQVRVTLPVHPDLRPGGYGRAEFLQTARRVKVAPENALRFDADGASVMVLQADERVRRVSVRTGQRAQGKVELLDGPPVGAQVLLGGGAFVLDGDSVRPARAAASGRSGAG